MGFNSVFKGLRGTLSCGTSGYCRRNKKKRSSEFQPIDCGTGLWSLLMECVSRRSLENTETIITTPKVAGVQREFWRLTFESCLRDRLSCLPLHEFVQSLYVTAVTVPRTRTRALYSIFFRINYSLHWLDGGKSHGLTLLRTPSNCCASPTPPPASPVYLHYNPSSRLAILFTRMFDIHTFKDD